MSNTKYSIGCGLFGIYAGVLKPNGIEWKNKTDVTLDAMGAVAQHLIDHNTEFRFEYKGRNMVLKVARDGENHED